MLTRAIELIPHDARAWANKGMALFNLNNHLEALDGNESEFDTATPTFSLPCK